MAFRWQASETTMFLSNIAVSHVIRFLVACHHHLQILSSLVRLAHLNSGRIPNYVHRIVHRLIRTVLLELNSLLIRTKLFMSTSMSRWSSTKRIIILCKWLLNGLICLTLAFLFFFSTCSLFEQALSIDTQKRKKTTRIQTNKVKT